MKGNKPAIYVVLAAAVLVAVFAWVFVDRNLPGDLGQQPETFSYGGKVKSANQGKLTLETYTIVPDPTGTKPPTVQTQERTARFDSKTQILLKAVNGTASTFQEGKASDLAAGKEAVVYTATRPTGSAEPYAQKIEIITTK